MHGSLRRWNFTLVRRGTLGSGAWAKGATKVRDQSCLSKGYIQGQVCTRKILAACCVVACSRSVGLFLDGRVVAAGVVARCLVSEDCRIKIPRAEYMSNDEVAVQVSFEAAQKCGVAVMTAARDNHEVREPKRRACTQETADSP
jgi:hypothetical protein